MLRDLAGQKPCQNCHLIGEEFPCVRDTGRFAVPIGPLRTLVNSLEQHSAALQRP